MPSEVVIERFRLAPYQRDFLYNPERFTGVLASTKAGKTAGAIQWAVEQWHDFSKPVGWETTWCGPVYEQSKIAFKRIKRTLPRAYDVNESSLTMFTPRGDELRFKSADNINHLYGPDARAVVFEEFTRARNVMDAFMALRSTLTTTRGKMKLIGNYIGEANAGHLLLERHLDDPEWAFFKVNAQMAVDAGLMAPEELEQARRDLDHVSFMALYMCEGTISPDMLIDWVSIGDLFTNEHVQGGHRYLTCDVARYGSDRTVIIRWEGLRVVEVIATQGASTVETAEHIRSLSKMHNIPRSCIIIDDDGVGGGVVDMLKGCVGFKNGSKPIAGDNYAKLKDQCYFVLADCINSHAMWYDVDVYQDEVRRELSFVRRHNMDKDGKLQVWPKEKVKEGLGRSPDFADALMMRMLPELQGKPVSGEHLTRRARAARSERFREELAKHWR